MGPFHCNHVKFNEGILEPILEELNIHWTNVRAKTPEDQFWKHEWDKHGTCAMQLDSMSNELKFFSKGEIFLGAPLKYGTGGVHQIFFFVKPN